MLHYELVVVLSPMLNQEQSAETWGRIKEFISNRNGEITHEERWGTRRLGYAIRKSGHNFLEGNYHLTRFSTERSFNRELETFLRVDEQVLRSLVVATAPPEPVPAPAPEAEPVAEVVAAPPEATGPATTEPAAEATAPEPAAAVAAMVGEGVAPESGRVSGQQNPTEEAKETTTEPGAQMVAASAEATRPDAPGAEQSQR